MNRIELKNVINLGSTLSTILLSVAKPFIFIHHLHTFPLLYTIYTYIDVPIKQLKLIKTDKNEILKLSFISTVSKIREKAVNTQVNDYLCSTNHICRYQSGICKMSLQIPVIDYSKGTIGSENYFYNGCT